MPRWPWSPKPYAVVPSFTSALLASVAIRRDLDMAHNTVRNLESMIWGVTGQYKANVSARRIWDAYKHNDLVYAAIRETVDSVISLPFYGERWVERGQRWQRLPDSHELPAFLRRPNSQIDPNRFWGRFNTHLALFGNGLARKQRGRGGRLEAMFNIRPDSVVIKEGVELPIEGYYVFREETFGTGKLIAEARIPLQNAEGERWRRYDVRDIIHVPLEPDPDFELWGQSPIVPALAAIVTDDAITAFLIGFFQRGAISQWIYTSKLPLSPEDRARMKATWETQVAGVDQAWGIAFVDGTEGELTRAGLAPGEREIGLHRLRMDVEARILAPLNVPPIMVGASIGLESMTYSNYREARFAMHEENSEPNLSRLEAALTFSVAPEFAQEGEILRVRVDTSRVMALEDWRRQRSERLRGELRDMGITINEFREGLERPPLDMGDVLILDLQRNPIPALASNEVRPPLPLPDWRVAALATTLQRKASVDELVDKQIEDSLQWALTILGATRQSGSVNREKVRAEVKLALTRYPAYDGSRAAIDEARRFLTIIHANTVHLVCRSLKVAFPALFDHYGNWRYNDA